MGVLLAPPCLYHLSVPCTHVLQVLGYGVEGDALRRGSPIRCARRRTGPRTMEAVGGRHTSRILDVPSLPDLLPTSLP
jgi:hypothetical protein